MVVPVIGFIGGMRYEKEEEQSYRDVDDDREFTHLMGGGLVGGDWWRERDSRPITPDWRSQSLSLFLGFGSWRRGGRFINSREWRD